MSMDLRVSITLFALACAVGNIAMAQEYPHKPIRFIVGPGPDVVARMIGQKLTASWGPQVVVDQRPGAGGIIAAETVAKSTPDGYTLLLTTGSMIMTPLMLPNAGFDPARDLVPVTQLVYSQGTILTARPDFPGKTLEETVSLAKKSPGKYNFGHTGAGTPPHIAAELFKAFAGIEIFGVPYKGTNNILTDIIGRQIDMTFSGIPSVLQFARSGQVRALASTGVRRTAVLPDVPTFRELGYEKMDIRGYYGLWAPAGTPRDRVDVLYHAAAKALTDPALRKVYEDGALEVVGSTPGEYAAFIRDDTQRQQAIVTQLGLHAAR
jgi:tripartite-type tricarboxylate transporter receptor subunit TctC